MSKITLELTDKTKFIVTSLHVSNTSIAVPIVMETINPAGMGNTLSGMNFSAPLTTDNISVLPEKITPENMAVVKVYENDVYLREFTGYTDLQNVSIDINSNSKMLNVRANKPNEQINEKSDEDY